MDSPCPDRLRPKRLYRVQRANQSCSLVHIGPVSSMAGQFLTLKLGRRAVGFLLPEPGTGRRKSEGDANVRIGKPRRVTNNGVRVAMKAMLLRRIAPIDSAPLELVDLPMPEPGPGEVRIRVRCCAVCRTDLHVIEGDLPQQKMPIIPGHQIVGTVDKLGPPLAAFARRSGCNGDSQLGQRVGVAWLRHTCGQCGFCTSGQGKPLRVGPLHRLSRRRRIRRVRRRPGGVLSTNCPRRSATSRPRRCCVPASSAIGRCGAAICRPAAGWPSTASARRPTW